jgi:hypothetical protein
MKKMTCAKKMLILASNFVFFTDQKFGFIFIFERNAVGEAPTAEFCFEIIRTQIRVHRDLNLGG